jgi:hypothetical protein
MIETDHRHMSKYALAFARNDPAILKALNSLGSQIVVGARAC